jgi:heme/copper-type cytochrome/quinol oxidase subunit 2
MTTSALIMMLSTWILVIFFTVYFFIRVLRSPHLHNPEEDALEDQLEDDN